jgi:hypothetical protein
MNEKHIAKIAQELKLGTQQILATSALLGEGATIPFVARYRKEATGSLDEVALRTIRDRLHQLQELDKRREVCGLRRYISAISPQTAHAGNRCQRERPGAFGPKDFYPRRDHRSTQRG